MKVHLQYWVIYFLALTLVCGSCIKPIDIPTSATRSCQIATLTIKELFDSTYQKSMLESETITIDGNSFRISVTHYTYDTLGRILTEYNRYEGSQRNYHGIADSVYYQYSPGVLYTRVIQFRNGGRTEDNYSYALNEQGFSKKYLGGQVAYTKDGYWATYTDSWGIPQKIVNGNIIESIVSLEGPLTECSIYRNKYDAEKAGMPPIQTYLGKGARNLIVGYTVDGKRYLNDPNTQPNLYEATYAYLFDDKDRVKRQIFHGKDNGYIYGGGSLVKTTDFSYTCP